MRTVFLLVSLVLENCGSLDPLLAAAAALLAVGGALLAFWILR